MNGAVMETVGASMVTPLLAIGATALLFVLFGLLGRGKERGGCGGCDGGSCGCDGPSRTAAAPGMVRGRNR